MAGGDAAADADAGADADADADAGAEEEVAADGSQNVQAFDGALGGAAPAVVFTDGADRPFEVNGATFLNAGAALQRSCAVQKNACANAANAGQIEGGTQQCDAQEAECLAANARKIKARRLRLRARTSNKARRQSALDFGECGSPAIQFAAGLDGRQEESFQNVNRADFSQGSALNIGIITSFTCNQLASACDAPEETLQACDAGAAAAQGAQGQAAADAFNAALGVAA